MGTFLKNEITKGNERSLNAKRNIYASFLLKIISIFISLQVVPLTINYVTPVKYGIWLTLSSIIGWMTYFDMGFAHGFRNRFAEAKAKGDIVLAQKYVSTTYVMLAIIFTLVFCLVYIVNNFINWSTILNVEGSLANELSDVFSVLALIFCINFIAQIVNVFLTANQKPAIASLFQTIGQIFAFLSLYCLTKFTEGSLMNLALGFTMVPCLFLILASIIIYSSREYSPYKPNFGSVDFRLTKNIVGLGGKFFFITISMLLIFQLINIILTRLQGPAVVTEYNIAYKYFNVLHMAAFIIITPYWTAFTDAYVKTDYNWMKMTLAKLEKMLLLCFPLILIMLLISPYIYNIWVGDSVKVSWGTSISVCLYMYSLIVGAMYMYLINGTGKIRIQLITYIIFAVFSYPMLYYSCLKWGVTGILIIPTVVYITQALIMRKQLKKIISNEAKGIWLK